MTAGDAVGAATTAAAADANAPAVATHPLAPGRRPIPAAAAPAGARAEAAARADATGASLRRAARARAAAKLQRAGRCRCPGSQGARGNQSMGRRPWEHVVCARASRRLRRSRGSGRTRVGFLAKRRAPAEAGGGIGKKRGAAGANAPGHREASTAAAGCASRVAYPDGPDSDKEGRSRHWRLEKLVRVNAPACLRPALPNRGVRPALRRTYVAMGQTAHAASGQTTRDASASLASPAIQSSAPHHPPGASCPTGNTSCGTGALRAPFPASAPAGPCQPHRSAWSAPGRP